MWLRWLLIFLLVVFILRFVRRLMQGVVEGMSGQATARGRGRTPVKMVADPVCGTYVIPGKALEATRSGHTHYFCSESCRDQWVRS